MEQNLQNVQLPVSIWKIIPTCYHRNKGEVEYIYICIYIFLGGVSLVLLPRPCTVFIACTVTFCTASCVRPGNKGRATPCIIACTLYENYIKGVWGAPPQEKC